MTPKARFVGAAWLASVVRQYGVGVARFRWVGAFLLEDDAGVTVVVFALMIVAILGLTSLVTDVGVAYMDRQMLQNAVDSAALAGAAYLPDNPTQALVEARAYANANGVTDAMLNAVTDPNSQMQVTSIYNPNDALVVSAVYTDTTGLRYLVGAGDLPISATATALVTAVTPSDLWPWAMTAGTPCSSGCTLKFGAQGSTDGNFGIVQYPGSNNYQTEIESGWNGVIPPYQTTDASGNPVWNWGILSETGNMPEPTESGIQQFIQWDGSKLCDNGTVSCAGLYTTVSDPSDYAPATSDGTVCITDLRCPRVGLIPTIEQSWSQLNGTSTVTVVGFQCIYLVGVQTSGGLGSLTVTARSLPSCDAAGGSPMYGVGFGGSGLVGETLWK